MLAEREFIEERRTLYRRTLVRAAHVAGGRRALAARLEVSPRELAGWLDGEEMPPVSAFLLCFDLLNAPGQRGEAGASR